VKKSKGESLKSIEEWFNKPLKGEQFQGMLDRLFYIPADAFSDICDQIIEESPPTPGRFPTVNRFKEGWQQWRMNNPSKIATPQRHPCKDCLGGGFLWIRELIRRDENDPGRYYETCYRCANCANWKIDVAPNVLDQAYRAQLEKDGFKVEPAKAPVYGKPTTQRRPMRKVIDHVAQQSTAMESEQYQQTLESHERLRRQAQDIMKGDL
jgi:hypothetical protein